MDLPSLAVVLQAALSPNPAERKAAEESLNKYQYTPQHLVRLLQIIVDGNCDLAVRQVASIHFKNFIAENWSPHDPDEQSKISLSDKDLVRQNILVFVEQVPTLLRAQLGECLKTIIHADYPEQWPGLLHWVTLNLQGQQVFGALFVLRILSRKYEFKSDEERTPVHHVVEETFPHLLNIFSRLVQIGNPSIEVADLIKLICKIYWSSIYLEIPKKLFDPNVFNAWMHLFLNILERPVPLEGQPADPDLRKSWGWWKVKKWTVHILNRLYTRFGDLKLQNPENKAFAQHFQKNYAGKILECHLNLLNAVRVGAYLPDRVTNLILQYLSNSISKAATYTLLQARLDVVLFEIIFPLMCFNDNDQKLWEEDPHEYVRKGYDIIEDLYSPRTAAMDFVSELVRKRGKDIYEEAPIEIKPYRQKDGALLAIGTLCDKLKQTEPYKSELEQMLVQHVFPEFSSPVGHIRAKAAWVAGQYAHINFSDPNNFRKALQSVVAGMRDPELPVRVDSVFALHSFVEACKDLGEIRPILPQLLDEFFKLMNEVENEDLVFTLETIVDKFGEEMAPYAVGLCQNLAAAFWKCMNTAEADDEADDPGDRFLCAFSRISAGGNAAGYYSYKWAEVLSADAGLNDDKAVRETGHRFHETILALGGGKPPLEAFLKTAEAIYKTMQDGAFCDRDNCVDEGETSTTGTSELEQAVGQMTLTGTVLPNDAVSDILTRLSVKELLKMKIVSKSWHALLSDPIFVKSHLKHSILNKEQRLFEWYSFKQYSCQPTGIVRANFIRDKDRPDNVKKIQVVGCVHGLMCISRLDGSNIHIWNPSIKAVTRIPPSHEHSTTDKSSYKTLLRFGFDPKTNDYKVVKLSFLHRFVDNSDAATQNVQAQVYSCVKVQVYSTRKGLWEWTAQPFPSDVTLMFTEDYLLVDGHDGHLHWINYTVGKHSIVAFDLSLERFHEIPLPHTESRHHLKHQFAVLDVKLCEILKRRDAAWDVLVMEEYGEPESWGTRFVIPNCSDWRRLVGFTLRGQLLATAKDDSIVLYDPSTKKTIRSADANSNFLHITEYVESLVWI